MSQGMEFQQERVYALVRLPGGDVAVPAGLGAAHGRPPGPPPGEKVGFESWTIRAVTSSRMAVWLGMVGSSTPCSLYNLTGMGDLFSHLLYQEPAAPWDPSISRGADVPAVCVESRIRGRIRSQVA